ncbi:MAG: DUF3307 domain-containing protein [Bacteroidota bacterium]|nr:DUF3307 domain-containing protein [Bacteroidota bacterium]
MQTAFTTDQSIILVRLILFHLLNDFLIQPNSWVEHRNNHHVRSSRLYWHGVLAGLVAFIAIGSFRAWPVFIVVSITHIAADLWKSHQIHKPNTLLYFLSDQIFHIVVLIACWLVWISGLRIFHVVVCQLYNNFNIWLLLLGYAICIFPLGYIVNLSTERWRKQFTKEDNSLREAGKWIGIIERSLVFSLVLAGQFQAVGLVITAKSILRFSDAETRKHSEYVLIGSLLSFTLAILTGFIVKCFLTSVSF